MPEYLDPAGKWEHNSYRFQTREEAEANARDLLAALQADWGWRAEWRVVESDDPINAEYDYDKRDVIELEIEY